MERIKGNKQVIVEWSEADKKYNNDFISTKLPTLLDVRYKELHQMGLKAKETCESWKATVAAQSIGNKENVSKMFNQFSDHMEVLSTRLERINNTTGNCMSQLHGSLGKLESTSTSVQQSTNILLDGMRSMDDTPKYIPLTAELQTIPKLLPAREILVYEWIKGQKLSSTISSATTTAEEEPSVGGREYSINGPNFCIPLITVLLKWKTIHHQLFDLWNLLLL